ncbi:HIRAN domain-containing protein [Lactiplantibacillus sp. WILCCON 0030]|uniref:HIRAN domain-containing protein n=1 Tax=Lactiplantibacillus brownii TaxID=3069269 RepID=A0ABU1A545_9LACO|nr:HIRAN domain-containing protein [Lactiplantibacillus brownii]MDQ7936106.1 HIRAN domain-containing protein [Lactiplantibacillus brownii]
MKLTIGSQVLLQSGVRYQVLAIIDQGQHCLAKQLQTDALVEVIETAEIVQIAELEPTNSPAITDQVLATVTVVGEHYVSDIQATLADLADGMTVLLQREANNQYDEQAISVWTLGHARLGYLSRHQNTPYAQLLDQGAYLYGKVSQLDQDEQKLKVCLFRVMGVAETPALQIQQRLAQVRTTSPAALPKQLLMTPLGNLIVKSNGRPLNYQLTPLTPWLTPDDQLTVTQRYLVTPEWSEVTDQSLVTCELSAETSVIETWQNATEQAVVLANSDSFYVVGLSAKTYLAANDNFIADTTQPRAFYRVNQVAAHQTASFVVSWLSFGAVQVKAAMQQALHYPSANVWLPYTAQAANQQQLSLTREELATLVVSPLPNYPGGRELAPSISDLTLAKIRAVLGDRAYHALASYRERVQLVAGSLDDVAPNLLQTIIHATIYHEISTLRYFSPDQGIISLPVYPCQLFSEPLGQHETKQIGWLAFYNFDSFGLQQVPLTAISSLAIIDNPEHPQRLQPDDELDWLSLFLNSWNDVD